MTTVHITDEDVENGRSVLKRALIDARKYTLKPEESLEPTSALGIAMNPHISFKNLLSLVLHKDENGWYADFILKKVPEGFPDVFGTSSGQPLASKREAYSQACKTVAVLRQKSQSISRTTPARKQASIIVGVTCH
jgi:hypothetical protein